MKIKQTRTRQVGKLKAFLRPPTRWRHHPMQLRHVFRSGQAADVPAYFRSKSTEQRNGLQLIAALDMWTEYT